MITQTECAWAAGLFDGEGCICIERYRPGRKCGERSVKFRFRIRVGMTSAQPVLRLRQIFGFGAISSQERKNGWKRKFTWAIEGERAARAVTLMLPYFTVKQQEAQLGLEFMEFQRRSVPASSGCKGATYATLQERQRFYEAMLALKVSKKKTFKLIPLPEFDKLCRVRASGINQQPLAS